MIERLFPIAKVLLMFIFLGLASLFPAEEVGAGIDDDTDFQAMIPPPPAEDQSLFKTRLQAVRRDIDAFRVFTESFSESGDVKTLEQLQTPVDNFLKKHVDNLLALHVDHSTLDTNRLTAEIMYIKARLLISLNRREDAANTVGEMKKRFGSYPKISVELPGRTTTLDEGIRMLDDELVKTASKNQ